MWFESTPSLIDNIILCLDNGSEHKGNYKMEYEYDPGASGNTSWNEKPLEDKKAQLMKLINMVGVDAFVGGAVKGINYGIFVNPDTFTPFMKMNIEVHWDIEAAQDAHAIKGDGDADETPEYNPTGPKC